MYDSIQKNCDNELHESGINLQHIHLYYLGTNVLRSIQINKHYVMLEDVDSQ